MADFLNAAFPWIVIGLAVAIFISYRSSKEKKQYKKEE